MGAGEGLRPSRIGTLALPKNGTQGHMNAMGAKKGPNVAEFPVGSNVRVKDKEFLLEFMKNWNYHNPLQPDQLRYSGRKAIVSNVGFYFGGDELYRLKGIPGVWHEICLEES